MPGKNNLTPIDSRKQLLLVESELNRVQLINELQELKHEIRHLKEQVETVGAIASSAVKLATTFSSIGSAFTRRGPDEKQKSSWISTLVNGARAGASLWSAFKSDKSDAK
jgi:hypothetical protein